ncbi:MAG: NAD(P)/FAD-dependent oxidoreductase [Aquabacterium sp.]|uniref:flavin monoamine oxidase family protein n=1 Tax=Aquabacterium sp. TaxID=1872578 RepID=UPI0011FB2C3E|nr:NAD(P)/FAD-dependent oxidoreductase [Aquabacterium sp.]TAK94012.1 MAG: NAD(P)/FAD-dependent oxidoreductase [Aquabacterium sp.]
MSWTRRRWLGDAGTLAASLTLPGLSACSGGRSKSGLRADLPGGWVGAHVDRAHAWRDGQVPQTTCAAPRRVHTLIIGAGVAGLSAAHALMKAGLDDLAVLDLENQPGGNARGHMVQNLPCPLGAHYLPMPGPDATEVAQWLEEIGLIQHEHGRWVADERHLCHSPQERLFVPDARQDQPSLWRGQWHDGLLPHQSLSAEDLAQYQRFSRDVNKAVSELGFAMPTSKRPWHAGLNALDQITFAQWLDQNGYTSRPLRWLLDYACRDDYGAGLGRVSAWAGLHYFASRHGFEVPGQGEAHDAVLTWPQGNGWLTQHLAQDLGARWQAGQVATRVDVGRDGVQVQTWHSGQQCMQPWVAQQVVMAVPLFVAQRLLAQPLPPLQAMAPRMAYAPWLVSNILLSKPFFDRPGAPLAWDNVPYISEGVRGVDTPALGYVDARHQSLAPVTGPMLLTHYWALGGQDAAQGQALRQALLKDDWRAWADRVAADLARVHPDLPGLVQQMDLMRYGHAMSIPVPGVRGHAALTALQQPQGRLHFAHSDLSAYSVFEEAFTHGVRAANQVLRASGKARSKV